MKTRGKRQEGDREATGNSDRRATGGNDRRATGERQEGAKQKLAWRHETTGSDRKRQDSDRRAARKRQGSDRGATGERQDSDRRATGKRQGSNRGLKVPKQRQRGDREATGWRQESEVARIYWLGPIKRRWLEHSLVWDTALTLGLVRRIMQWVPRCKVYGLPMLSKH